MTLRSARRYAAVICFAVLAVSLAPGCGGRYSDANGDSLAIAASGTLSLRGGQPYPILMLETADGGEYLLRSSRLLEELRHLNGMRVELRGTTPANPSVTIPVLTVESYRLLALDDGAVPLIGTIENTEERCVLAVDGDTRLTVVGEFEHVLGAFPGAKVWVIGERPDTESIHVTGYGIIVPSKPPENS